MIVELTTVLSTIATGVLLVKVCGAEGVHAPPPAVDTGVTVTVAVTGIVPVLIALKDAMFPDPLAARPMDGVLLVQLYIVPATGPLNVTGAVGAPLQTAWLGIGLTVGVGFTVTVAVIGAPTQPLAVGVIVNVVVCAVLVVLVSVPLMLPLPDAAMPVKLTRLSLVHE